MIMPWDTAPVTLLAAKSGVIAGKLKHLLCQGTKPANLYSTHHDIRATRADAAGHAILKVKKILRISELAARAC
jgi:hypothetical protein